MPAIHSLLALTALITGMAATPPAAAAERLSRIPAPFRGVWMAEPRHCRAEATDESWLRITASDIRFYESAGPVLAVVARGPREIGVISELSGEGTTWLHLERMRLDPTGNLLTLAAVGLEGETTRVRCPGR